MCTVSKKIKLCTCNSPAALTGDYWTLFRFVEGRNVMVIGEPVMPAVIDPAKDRDNQNLLLKLLNEGNAFDAPLFPMEKDKLLISFDLGDKGRLSYGYLFKKGQWHHTEYDIFEWQQTYKEVKEGSIAG
jgi:hypothetical protein